MSINPYESPVAPDAIGDVPSEEAVRPKTDRLGVAIFGAAIRIAGVLVGLNGLKWFYFGFTNVFFPVNDARTIEYVLSAVMYVIGGLILLNGAPYFERFAYPSRPHAEFDEWPEKQTDEQRNDQ